MSIVPRKPNPHDLTQEEIEFLRSTVVPGEVKDYLSRQHENIGTKITAYRKVAAAARAECDAILAARDLDAAKGVAVDLAEVRQQVQAYKRKAEALEAKVSEKDETIMQLTAGPALAVHSDG